MCISLIPSIMLRSQAITDPYNYFPSSPYVPACSSSVDLTSSSSAMTASFHRSQRVTLFKGFYFISICTKNEPRFFSGRLCLEAWKCGMVFL